MFDLPFDLIQPRIPAAIPPAPPPEIPAKPDKPAKPKRKRQELKHLSEDEIARLFAVISSVRDRAMFQIAYRAGLRASEIGILQLRDYDPKAAKIFVHRLKGSNSGEHHLVREEARAWAINFESNW